MMFPAPVGGWISNRSLALPKGQTPGAALMDNYFPRAETVKLRRGKQRYATLADLGDAKSLFSYRNGNNRKLFGASETVIYDLTNVVFPDGSEIVDEDDDLIETEGGDTFGWFSTDGMHVATDLTSGDWSVVQFATTGGVYLVGVNGTDPGFIFDGTAFWPNMPGGYYRIAYDAESAAFEPGEIVTGGTSGATATVNSVEETAPGVGYLYIYGITGTFQDNETLTGDVAGSSTADGVPVLMAPGMAFDTLSSAAMSFVFSYKSAIYFIEKESMNVWYLPPDQVGGDATLFPMAGIFDLGGALLFGSNWSLQASDSGGLSEQVVFVTSEGQAAIFQGINPDDVSWTKVGTYRTGRPLGKRAFFRGGGDIAIATSVGLVPLSKAIELDVTSLNVATVSYNIADAWSNALTLRGAENWICELWPEEKMALVVPPDLIGDSNPVAFVVNAETGAWCRFTGWKVLCMEVFEGQLYFGSTEGRIFLANVGGSDDGAAYTGSIIPMFEDCGSPMSRKIGGMVRAVSRANVKVNAKCGINYDFSEDLPAAPDALAQVGGSLWGTAVWGESRWGDTTPSVINQPWNSGGGYGYTLAPTYQVTSGSIGAFDDELIRMDLSYTVAEVVT
jgi:hypothetical protein